MISVENLTKQYGATTVVDGVSMVIERNSITVIVGTSGSGKSTLLRMINRLVEPTRGRVLIDGNDTTGEPAHLLRRRIGYVIQGHGLFPHRTVAENIATVPRLLGWDAARIRARVEELLCVFQLDPQVYAAAFPHQLSGGEQQRVGVARALAAEPAVLLMDEPFGALDPIIRAKAQDDLLDIQRRFGTTILLVTHDMDEAFRLGDRVAVMSHGRLLQYDRPAVLLTRPADPFVSRMTGISDRAMRLLSLTTAGEAAATGRLGRAGRCGLRLVARALSELVWCGASLPRSWTRMARGADASRSQPSSPVGDRADAGRGHYPATRGARAAAGVPADATELRAAVRAAHAVWRAADLRSGQPPDARARASWHGVFRGCGEHPRGRRTRYSGDAPRAARSFLPLSRTLVNIGQTFPPVAVLAVTVPLSGSARSRR